MYTIRILTLTGVQTWNRGDDKILAPDIPRIIVLLNQDRIDWNSELNRLFVYSYLLQMSWKKNNALITKSHFEN